MARSIGDFYADAEGRGSELSGYDWENDDAPDRTPDAWLDRLASSRPAQRVGLASAKGAKGRSGRRGSANSVTRKGQSPAGSRRPTEREIANAAHEIRASIPDIGAKGIAKRLRQRGWAFVDSLAVDRALKRYVIPDRKQKSRSVPSRGTGAGGQELGRVQGVLVQQGGAMVGRRLRNFAKVARYLAARDPEMSLAGITRRLQRLGWPTCTEADVRRALGMSPTAAPRPTQASPPPKSSRPAVDNSPSLRAAPRPSAEVCPSCAVRISVLGICRCS